MTDYLVRKLEHFTRLSADDKAVLATLTNQRVERVAAHADIAHEGDAPDEIRIFLQGWACRYKMLEDGRRQIVAFFMPGDLGDQHAFVLRQLDHSIASITPVVFARASREAFEDITSSYPRITQALWWASLVENAIQREWTLNLGQRDAVERMAHLFCELHCRQRMLGLDRGNVSDLPLTQAELADTLGVSAVHVNRILQELRNRGLVELKGRELKIPDLDALRAVAQFNANYLHLDREGRHLDAND